MEMTEQQKIAALRALQMMSSDPHLQEVSTDGDQSTESELQDGNQIDDFSRLLNRDSTMPEGEEEAEEPSSPMPNLRDRLKKKL